MGAKAIKLGSLDKHPAYCYDWNVNECHAGGVCAFNIGNVHMCIRTSNRKVLGLTPDRSTRNFFFRVCLCHY